MELSTYFAVPPAYVNMVTAYVIMANTIIRGG